MSETPSGAPSSRPDTAVHSLRRSALNEDWAATIVGLVLLGLVLAGILPGSVVP